MKEKIKFISKKVWNSKWLLCGILLLAAIIRLFLGAEEVFRGINTEFDDGFYHSVVYEAINGNILPSPSLWHYFVKAIFPVQFTDYFVNLRLFIFGLSLLGMILFFSITFPALKRKGFISNIQESICYLSIVLLLSGSQSCFDFYNTFQYFFFEIEIALFIRAYCCSKGNILSFFIIGFLGVFSLLTIPPSGAMVFLALAISTFAVQWDNKKRLIQSVISAFIGCMVAWGVVHFFILDLREVYSTLFQSASHLASVNRGYAPKDHIIRLLFYFRDFFIICCLLGGLLCVYKAVNKRNYTFATLLFILGLVVFQFYQKKPTISTSTLLLFPCVILFLQEVPTVFSHKKVDKNFIVFALLIVLPLFSVFGTNIHYETKMIHHLISLSVPLFFILIRNKQWKPIVLMLLLFPIGVSSVNRIFDNKKYIASDIECLKHIRITPEQQDYFNQVNTILEHNNFVPKEDYFYATTYHHMAVCVSGGRLIRSIQHPNDFLVIENKESLPIPNFIFLSDWDSTLLYQPFSEMNWGFPEEFERYPIGHPTMSDVNGYLYCKKKEYRQLITE